MADRKVILRYIKVREMALRGTDGERVASRAALNRIEADNPGITKEADKLEAEIKAQEAAEVAGTSPPPAKPKSTSPFLNIEFDWNQAMNKAFEAARNLAESMSDAQIGAALAEEVEDDMKATRQNALHFVLKFEPSVILRAKDLSPIQREAFVQALHEVLDAHMAELFSSLDEVE